MEYANNVKSRTKIKFECKVWKIQSIVCGIHDVGRGM